MRLISWISVWSIALALVMTSPAAAGPQWCEDDPIFVINGRTFRVTTRFPAANLQAGTVVSYTLVVPPGSTVVSWYEPGPQPVAATVVVVEREWVDEGGAALHVTVSGVRPFDIEVTVESNNLVLPQVTSGPNTGSRLRLDSLNHQGG